MCASRLMTVIEAGGKARRFADSSLQADDKSSSGRLHERRGENELLKQAVRLLRGEQAQKVVQLLLSNCILSNLKTKLAVNASI